MKNVTVLQRVGRALSSAAAIVCLLVIPAGYLALTDLPLVLEMQVKMARAGSVRVGTCIADPNGGEHKVRYDRVKSCLGGASWQKMQVFLPVDFDPDGMILDFDGDATSTAVQGVSLSRRFVFKQAFDVMLKDGVWCCHPIGSPRLSLPKKWCFVFVAFVICVFVLSLGSTWLFAAATTQRERIVLSFLIAVTACVFVGFAVPLQSYLANRSSFLLTTGEFVGESLLFVAVATMCLGAALYFSTASSGYFLHSLVLAFVIYEYLQTGVLAIGEPPLNGDVTYYTNAALKKRDLIVFCASFAPFVIGYHWVRRYLSWLVVMIGVMIAASFFDIKVEKIEAEEGADGLALAAGLCSKFDAAQNTCYSAKRNIMMIVLDSVTTEVFTETLERNPELKSWFDGFTEFRNNFCPHTYTQYGVAVYMTGKCYEEERATPATIQEYAISCFGTDSSIIPFLQQGNAISFVPGSTLFGYSWPIRSEKVDARNDAAPAGPAFFRRKNEVPPLSLFDVSRVRLTPFGAKGALLVATFAGTKMHASIRHEHELYPILANAPIRDDINMSLTIFHTEGAHPPFDVGKDGVPLSVPRMDFDGYCDKTYWVLKQVGDLLDAFRSRGIYDNSMVILTTDHGSGVCRERLADGLTGHARAMLCVKPEYAKGPLRVSNMPTSHTRLHDLVVLAKDRELSLSEITSTLHQETRQYILPSPSCPQKWVIDKNGVASRQ